MQRIDSYVLNNVFLMVWYYIDCSLLFSLSVLGIMQVH
jgi:hypothetical protein